MNKHNHDWTTNTHNSNHSQEDTHFHNIFKSFLTIQTHLKKKEMKIPRLWAYEEVWFFQRYPAPKTGSWPPSAIIQAMLELHRTNRPRTFLCFTKDPPPNKQDRSPKNSKIRVGSNVEMFWRLWFVSFDSDGFRPFDWKRTYLNIKISSFIINLL